MSTPQHTPGPWSVAKQTHDIHGLPLPRDRYVVQHMNADGSGGVGIASLGIMDSDDNARLIAAAPDMLEALTLCAQFVADGSLNDGCGHVLPDGVTACLKRKEALALIRAAIAKATGGAQ